MTSCARLPEIYSRRRWQPRALARLRHHAASDASSNIDIGGGTTKLSVIENGTILESSVVRVGSRGVVTDESRTVTRVEVSGARAGEALELPIHVGSEVSEPTLQGGGRPGWLHESMNRSSDSPNRTRRHRFGSRARCRASPTLRLWSSLRESPNTFTGRTTTDYNDLGRWLAASVDEQVRNGKWTWETLPVERPLRATAVGISQYTVEVSGDTVFVGDDVPLPIRNRRVVFG